ncbi:MAG: nuclear transport factor 2 family protein [Gemmatirosa sp.]
MPTLSADRFVAALRRVEDEGDVDAMVALYADDAVLRSPTERASHTGAEGARRFWTAYRQSFETVRSRFHAVLESDTRIMLEWTSDCRTAAGADTSYSGVSCIETRDGAIVRFHTYFDPAQLHAAVPMETAMRPVGRAPRADGGAASTDTTSAPAST